MRLDFWPRVLATPPTLITGSLVIAAAFALAGIMAYLICLITLIF